MTHNIDIKKTFEALLSTAAAQVAQYPQYASHFRGYILARVKRDVITKAGLAFKRGEYVLAAPKVAVPRLPSTREFHTAWSRRNAVDTSILAADLEYVL